MTTHNDDIYSLLKWCREQELEAHNKAMDDMNQLDVSVVYRSEAIAFGKMISKIQSMKQNQWPHVIVKGCQE